MNGTAAVQGGLVAPVQGRTREASVKDEGADGAREAGEDFDDLLSQGSDAAEASEAETTTDETASGGRQAVVLAALASLGFILATPDDEAGAPQTADSADPMAALKAVLAAAGDNADAVDAPEGSAGDAPGTTDPAAEALALLGSASEEVEKVATPPVAERKADETMITVAVAKRETHFAPVAQQHLAPSAAQPPPSNATARPEAVADGGETTLDGPLTPVGATQGASGNDADGKSDADGGRDGGGGDRRPGLASAASGVEFAGAAGAGERSGGNSPVQQVARRVADALGVGGPAGLRLEATQSGGPDGMTKVLHIQLEPANLGTVTVRVSLKDNVLNLHVEAARHETALAIEKDRELLSGALKRSGYIVDGITAQPADQARGSSQVQAAADSQSSSFSSSTNPQSGHSQSGQQSGLRNTRTDGSGEERSSHRGTEPASGVNDSARGTGRGVSGELYV